MNTAENVTFMVVRGIIALAIVGLAFYCIAKGIYFFSLPRAEAEQIHIKFVGLDITASGLGAVIFGTGIALCFVGKETAPKRIETKRTTEGHDPQGTAQPEIAQILTLRSETPAIPEPPPAPRPSGSYRTTEGTTIAEGPKERSGTPPIRLD